MAKAREAGYEGFFIVLSGASDFTYAQKAIRSSASFYLTKPVDEDELADAVKEVAERLDAKRDTDSRLVRNATGNVISRLLSGTYDPAEDHLDDYGLVSDCYQVVACEPSGRAPLPDDHLSRLLSVSGVHPDREPLILGNRQYLLLQGQSLIDQAASVSAGMRGRVPSPLWQQCLTAFGRIVKRPEDIAKSCTDADKLLDRRFFYPASAHVLVITDLPADGQMPVSSVSVRFAKEICDCIQARNRERLAELLTELGGILTGSGCSVSACRVFLTGVYISVRQDIAHIYHNDLTGLSSESHATTMLGTIATLRETLDFLDRQFESFANAVHTNAGDDTIQRIQQYIRANCGKTLKLEEIGPLFGYNSSYLGKLFRAKADCSFNEYVDRVRIDEAKRLLENSSMKVYEIAQRLGYRDVDYFHKKFRKYVGLTPNEYRRSPGGKGQGW
jgi:two-component system response regulator YesN